MQSPVKISIVQQIVSCVNRQTQGKNIIQRLNRYQKEILERDLKNLNDTLLPALKINPSQNLPLKSISFTQQYLNLSQKVYMYKGLIQKEQIKQKQKQSQQLSPFLSNNVNFKDIFANSKQLSKVSSISINDNTPNFSHILASTIKSTFLGEHKATYPTIIYQGQQPHPIRNFNTQGIMQSTNLFRQGLQTLGGIKDSLSKVGLQNLSLRKKQTFSNSKYSNLAQSITRRPSNTKTFKIQEPLPPPEPMQNPFVRNPPRKK